MPRSDLRPTRNALAPLCYRPYLRVAPLVLLSLVAAALPLGCGAKTSGQQQLEMGDGGAPGKDGSDEKSSASMGGSNTQKPGSDDKSDDEAVSCERGFFDHDDDPTTPCRPWSTCPPGQYVTEEGSRTSDRGCSACEEGSFSDTENAESCSTHRDCGPGERVTRAATDRTDRNCEPCAAGTFNATDNRQSCTPCPTGTFSLDKATECTDWTSCEPGTYVSNAGTTGGDRTCSPCPEDTESTVENQSECLVPRACPAGTVQVSPETEDDLAVCLACVSGEHCPGGAAPRSSCKGDTWDHDANPATSCVTKTKCGPGRAVSDEGSSNEDRTCSECPAGTFNEDGQMTSCSECPAGTFSQPGASECTTCPTGTDSDPGASECTCVPRCEGKVCGGNGCGGTCGSCIDGFSCEGDQSACVPDQNRRFRIESQIMSGYCLEGNSKETGPDHGGNAFIYPCADVTGQLWTLVPNGSWYKLKTLALGDEKCLEGNNPDHGGSAFMDDCEGVTGQNWKWVEDGAWFRLKTEFQTDARCLDSNDPSSSGFDGAVYMNDCRDTAFHRWKFDAR